jgi:hypothetical protein
MLESIWPEGNDGNKPLPTPKTKVAPGPLALFRASSPSRQSARLVR